MNLQKGVCFCLCLLPCVVDWAFRRARAEGNFAWCGIWSGVVAHRNAMGACLIALLVVLLTTTGWIRVLLAGFISIPLGLNVHRLQNLVELYVSPFLFPSSLLLE